jgi:hypothetical protein
MKIITHLLLSLFTLVFCLGTIGGMLGFKSYYEANMMHDLNHGTKRKVVVISSLHDARCYYKDKAGQKCWELDVPIQDKTSTKTVSAIEKLASYMIIRNYR